MKEFSIEQKAQAYDGLIERLKDLKFAYRFSPLSDTIEEKFPELREESKDERIKKELIDFVKSRLAGFPQCEKFIDWLEKQTEHTKFRNKIQVGDKVTRNRDGMLVNLSQLNRVAKKQGEQKPTDKIQLGKKYKCIASPRYTAFMKGSIYEPKDKFLCSLMNFCSDCFEPIEYVEQKPADKVEPKFKVGDWIIRSAENFEHNKYLITEIRDYYTCKDLKDRRVTFTFNDVHKNFKLWDISDAKDGDVLCCESGWTCIFKELNHNSFGEKLFDSHCFIDQTKWFHNGAKGHTLNERINGKIYPATKEQRDLLFQKMKEAGYEWDTEKKELKKVEQKHFCKLDNSYARIKFPFKAKVKSSGKIVTIHDGQLSYDGKEWIKYQSDAKDGYKVYEPNNLLESVCETEQNSAQSEEDEKMLNDIVKDLVHPWNEYIPDRIEDEIKWLKSLKDRVQPQSKQEWSKEDEKAINDIMWIIEAYRKNGFNETHIQIANDSETWLKSLRPQNWTKKDKERYISCLQRLGTGNPEQPETINSKWFKEHVYPQTTWKPSDEQMKALADALSLAKNCGEEIAFDLRTLHEQLKKLRED